MKNVLLLLAVLVVSCAPPDALAGADAGPGSDAGPSLALDAGPQQCAANDGGCWVAQTFCEAAPCSYQFPDTGGRCGTEPIRPSCFCGRDPMGAFHVMCTGGCVPGPDGGSALTCLTPDCGTVNCGSGTTCVGYGRCE